MIQRYNLEDKDYQTNIDPTLLSTLYLRHIYKRVHINHFNFLGIITGKHRTGKSLASLSLSHALDPTFFDEMENRVVYYANDFLRVIKDLSKRKIIGGCVVFDESGIGYGSRDWYQESNKAVGGAMQVVGRYQPIVFFVSQDIRLIDSQIRKYFHAFFEMNRHTKNYAFVKAYGVSQDKKSGKIYHLYSRFNYPNEDASGKKIRFIGIRIKRPPKELEKRYEDHSKVFKDFILDQMYDKTKTFDEKKVEKEERMSDKDIVKFLVDNKENKKFLYKTSTPENIRFDSNAIRYRFNITDSKAKYLKKLAEYEAQKTTKS